VASRWLEAYATLINPVAPSALESFAYFILELDLNMEVFRIRKPPCRQSRM
jgi:hypothetical protein